MHFIIYFSFIVYYHHNFALRSKSWNGSSTLWSYAGLEYISSIYIVSHYM